MGGLCECEEEEMHTLPELPEFAGEFPIYKESKICKGSLGGRASETQRKANTFHKF